MINKGKEVFDTIVEQGDTTIIDYVGFNYDESNVITQSGAIHFIDHLLRQHKPSRSVRNFHFWEDPQLSVYRETYDPGNYIIKDTSLLEVITWSGSDLILAITGDEQSSGAWDGDYLLIDGEFMIRYTFPKIVPGKYEVFLGVDTFNSENALIEVYIDGKKTGGLINLANGAGSPFERIELGAIDFHKYEEHTFEIVSFIPGRLAWDYIRFEPV
jgi:hypothetical protein